jgi:hypothetical protein
MIKGNLTKSEALTAMRDGHKVLREYFSSEEYVFMNESGTIMSEDGYNFEEWWKNIEPTIPSSSPTPWRIIKQTALNKERT